MISFEEFEQGIMQKLLEKNTLINKKLREQYQKAHVVDRKFQKNVPPITESIERGYGNVICDMNGIKNFGGFVLFLENGVIKGLERYTFQDECPSVIMSYSLQYADK